MTLQIQHEVKCFCCGYLNLFTKEELQKYFYCKCCGIGLNQKKQKEKTK